MEGHPRFVWCKSRPVGYVGWRCAVTCLDCDKEWVGGVLEQLDYLYAQDPENLRLEVWQKSKKKKTCRFLFISFPMGDQPLITFVLSRFNLIVTPWQGDPMNANRLTKPGENDMTVHTVFESMIDAYEHKEYERIGQIVNGRTNAIESEDGSFYLFMCLLGLTRLHAKRDERPLGIAKYLEFHEKHNGQDSKQYAQALVLSVFCLGFHSPKAVESLQKAIHILGEDDYVVNLLRGHYAFRQGKYDHAVTFYAHAHINHYPEIAIHLVFVRLWQHAYPFVWQVYHMDPSRDNKARLAWCHYALGEKHDAIRLIGVPKRQSVKTWPKSDEYRICRFCRTASPIAVMTQCVTCRDTYYCDGACLEMNAVHHREKDCRYCRSCKDLIPAGKRRLRCSACWTTFYCSAECQNQDWFDGDHKSTCGK